MFSLELLQAINDWQCGGNAKQKALRGENLRRLSKDLPPQFKETSLCCFRQISIDKVMLWKLGTELCLPETISGWTLSIEVAENFKGGVPSTEWQGFIFEIVPKPSEIIINLDALYRDAGFIAAYREKQPEIIRFSDGIGRYGNSQHEVVLEIARIRLDSAYAMGGYSSDRQRTAQLMLGRDPTDEDLKALDWQLSRAGRKLGPAWVTGLAKDRVVESLIKMAEVLKSESSQPCAMQHHPQESPTE